MNEPAVLLISRDPAWIKMNESMIRQVGSLRVAVVAGLDQAYAYDGWDRVALVLIQHRRGEAASGVARLFRMLSASRRAIATVVPGEGIDEETELDLLRRGAADCLLSPYDLDRLSYLIETLTLRTRQPDAGRISSAGEAEVWDDSDPIVAQARRVAGQDATVLIRGEAGTGKSRLARIIHDLSPRKKGPLVTLRCGALTAEGFEEELFGAPGESARPSAQVAGKLEEAREGTLVLDDVDALTPTAQVALLRWVEEGSRESSSRARGRPDRPRVVATTRTALGDRVAEGGFRSDLFFRLNVIGLELPPLRQRKVEIISIALGVLAEVAGRSVTIGPDAISGLEGYTWPGNVREMREVLEAAVAAGGREVVGLEHLPRGDPGRGESVFAPSGGGGRGGGWDIDARGDEARGGVSPDHPGASEERQQPAPDRQRAGDQPDDPLQEALQVRDHRAVGLGASRVPGPFAREGAAPRARRRGRFLAPSPGGRRSSGGRGGPGFQAGGVRRPPSPGEIGTGFALTRHRLQRPRGFSPGRPQIQGGQRCRAPRRPSMSTWAPRIGTRSRVRKGPTRSAPGSVRPRQGRPRALPAGPLAGPAGAAVGAVIGAVAGGLAGKGVAESIDPTVETTYWREKYATRPYFEKSHAFEHYEPAYRYGWESRARYADKTFDAVETDLARDWDKVRGHSKMSWDKAKHATRDAWDRLGTSVTRKG